MVKFAVSLIVASIFAVSALASTSEDYVTRDVADYDIFSRDLEVHHYVSREYLEGLFERNFEDIAELTERDLQELYERDPNKFKNFFKKIGKGIANAAKKVASFVLRDVDGDLSTRESVEFGELLEREFNDIEAREPLFFGKALKAIIHKIRPKPSIGSSNQNQNQNPRGLEDDLFERAFDEDLFARDLHELYERDPNKFKNFFKKIGKGIANVAKKVGGFLLKRDEELDLAERDFDEDLFERDLDFDGELFERYFDEEVYERDFDEDVFERDFSDLEDREIDEMD